MHIAQVLVQANPAKTFANWAIKLAQKNKQKKPPILHIAHTRTIITIIITIEWEVYIYVSTYMVEA